MILPTIRDPRFITVRRGGMLTDADHRLLALWAATCAEHVLHHFEAVQPSDPRPRRAIAQIRVWVRGEITMSASRAAAPDGEREEAGLQECRWQRAQLPVEIRALVLDDQSLRNEICWSVFEC